MDAGIAHEKADLLNICGGLLIFGKINILADNSGTSPDPMVKTSFFCHLLLLILTIFSITALSVFAESTDPDRNYEQISDNNPYSFYKAPALGAILIYQSVISPSKGTLCPMSPSCSRYGAQAFTHYTPLKAMAMTADRLHRCGHDLNNYDVTEMNGMVRASDPLPQMEPPHKNEQNRKVFSSIPDTTSACQGTAFLDEDKKLYGFAQSMQADGDLIGAITEYRRLLSYFPDSRFRESAVKSVFFCYYTGGQYLQAIHWGQNYLFTETASASNIEFVYATGVAYFNLKNFRLARQHFSMLMNTNDRKYADKAQMLNGLSYAEEYSWDKAINTFALVPYDSPYAEYAQQCKVLSENGKRLPIKNPTTAGLLAIIPGLGYLYDGYPQTAFSSFIVNGLFIWGASEAFRQNNDGIGTLMGILSFGWYSGNIYGSVVSAEKSNIHQKRNLTTKFNIGFTF